MEKTPEFAVLLRLIDERSTAFRAAVMSAPGLEPQVPTCPEWTLLDLVLHGRHRCRRKELPGMAAASIRGTAGNVVLALYDRIPIDFLQLDGDRRLFDLLRA